jgi:thiol-disulfide isomerase/thioredoxin
VVFLIATTFVGGPLDRGRRIDFTVRDLAGGEITRAALDRPVVLYVFATWCSACKLTTPTVDGFARRHPEVAVLAVGADDPDAVRAAAAEAGWSFRVIPDGGALAETLGVRALPTTIVLDASGEVRWNRQGVLVPGELDLRVP